MVSLGIVLYLSLRGYIMIKKINRRTISLREIKLKRLISKRLIKISTITSVVLLSLLFIVKNQEVTQAKIPEYLYFQKGTLPVVISIPHDGRLEKDGLPERVNSQSFKNFSNARDNHTTVTGLSISENIERLTGKKPYIIVNLLHRKYMDPNRAPNEAYEHPLAGEIYNQYDSALKEAITEINKKYKKGILLDIHGQTEFPDDVYLISLDGKTIDQEKETTIRQILQDRYKVASSSPEKLVIEGSMIDRHGRHNLSGIDAIEIEIHHKIRSNQALREKFAKDLSEAILQ